jgi:hypothetical protein
LHPRGRASLAATLDAGETPRVLIGGLGGSAIIGTESRAFVFKKGAKFGAPFGHKFKVFEYESVMRIALVRTNDYAAVVLHAPLKMSVCPVYWADPRDDPWKARNAIPVERGLTSIQTSLEVLAGLVEEFNHRHDARHPTMPDRRQADPPLVLERLAELEQRAGAGPAREDCLRCGNELGAGWEFCPRCGAPANTGKHASRRTRRAQRPAGA